jgi:hypothetical protein
LPRAPGRPLNPHPRARLGERNGQRTLSQLKEKGFVREGDLVVVVSDVRPQPAAAGQQQQQQPAEAAAAAAAAAAAERNIRSVQVRHVR